MGVYSGVGGFLNGQSVVRNWELRVLADLQSYIASNTKGMEIAIPGDEDWSGSFSGWGHTPAVMPGEAFSFAGSVDGTNGFSGTAIVDQVQISCNIEGRRPIEYSVNFSRNGDLTIGSVAGSDAALTIPPQSDHNCVVQQGTVAAEPVWAALANIRTWQLTITSANVAYKNSSTSGKTLRKAGNLSASFSFGVHVDTVGAIPTVNTVKGLRFYVSSTTYWELLWGIYGEASGIQVDRESGAIVGATLNGRYRGYTVIGSTDTIGSIKDPSGATFWPPA